MKCIYFSFRNKNNTLNLSGEVEKKTNVTNFPRFKSAEDSDTDITYLKNCIEILYSKIVKNGKRQ